MFLAPGPVCVAFSYMIIITVRSDWIALITWDYVVAIVMLAKEKVVKNECIFYSCISPFI